MPKAPYRRDEKVRVLYLDTIHGTCLTNAVVIAVITRPDGGWQTTSRLLINDQEVSTIVSRPGRSDYLAHGHLDEPYRPGEVG